MIERILSGLPPKQDIDAKVEKEFHSQLKKAKDDEARETLVQNFVLLYMRDCVSYGEFVAKGSIEADELFSLVYLELHKAAFKFDPKFGRFATYAKQWVWGRIHKHWKIPEVSRNNSTSHLRYEETVENRFELTNPNEPIVHADFDVINYHEQNKKLDELMKRKLNLQEQMVIDLVYRSSYSLAQIGEKLSVTRAAIQATHERAVRKLKRAYRAEVAHERVTKPC